MFLKFRCVRNSDMKSPLRLALYACEGSDRLFLALGGEGAVDEYLAS
jgi:hypothetical protein